MFNLNSFTVIHHSLIMKQLDFIALTRLLFLRHRCFGSTRSSSCSLVFGSIIKSEHISQAHNPKGTHQKQVFTKVGLLYFD